MPHGSIVNSTHPLVGIWVEEENPFDTTTVAYTVEARSGGFNVSGVDECDGIALQISNTTWDGENLRFLSVYPPTQHKANHEFQLTGNRRAKHTVSYSDEYGHHRIDEVWKKRPVNPQNRNGGTRDQ
jgi:hypothetical protein